MAIYYYRELPEGGLLAIWEIVESIEEFLASYFYPNSVLERLANFKSDRRKREVLALYALIAELLPNGTLLCYNSCGAPSIEGGQFNVGISHSRRFVALILHPNREVGVDVESVGRNFLAIEQRALSVEEQKSISPSVRELQLALFWSAKECLFKTFRMSDADFAKDIAIESFLPQKRGTLRGSVKVGEARESLLLYYEELEDHILVWSIR